MFPPTRVSRLAAPPAALPQRADVIINAVGIVDQAIQTLFQLRNLERLPTAPRSLVLDIIQLNKQFNRNERFLSQVNLLAAAGSTIMRLGREWSNVTKNHEGPVPTARDPYRYYKVASLAAASILIPWLLVRRRR